MNRLCHFLPLVLVALLLLLSFVACGNGFADGAQGDGEDPTRRFEKLERGMNPEQVRQVVGAPKHIARQILYHHYREQWLYEAAVPVCLTFDCQRGQKPQLLSFSGLPKNH